MRLFPLLGPSGILLRKFVYRAIAAAAKPKAPARVVTSTEFGVLAMAARESMAFWAVASLGEKKEGG
jgi:hypothetical protein